MWAPEYLSRACASTGPHLVQCRDHMWPHICLLILNMRRTNLGLRWNPVWAQESFSEASKSAESSLVPFRAKKCTQEGYRCHAEGQDPT